MDNNINIMKSARYGFKKFEDFVWNKHEYDKMKIFCLFSNIVE